MSSNSIARSDDIQEGESVITERIQRKENELLSELSFTVNTLKDVVQILDQIHTKVTPSSESSSVPRKQSQLIEELKKWGEIQ